MSTVADLRAQNALKTAQADYMEGARALVSDPETGFLSRTGSDAINGVGAVEAQLEDLARGIAERLPGQVRPKFRDFRIGHNTNLGREMLRHKAEQTKAETRTASDRRIAVLKQEAVRNSADPVAHVNSLREAEQEVRTMAGLEGLSDEAAEQRVAELRDGVQSDIILQMAEADPLVAHARYEAVKDSLQDETRQGIERILAPSLEIARADLKADEIFSGISAARSGNIARDTSDLLVDSVANNALSLRENANSDTLTGSAGNDTLIAPDPERIERVEQVRQRVRQRGEVNAIRLTRAGVMLSPGNLLFSTILGAPLAIAVTRAEPDAPLASLLADTLGIPSDAPLRAEFESEFGEATAGDLRNEFSKGAAQHFGGVDVEASLVGIENPQERLLATDQVSTRFAAGHTQQRVSANQRIKAAFSEIANGNGLSGLSLDAKAALQGSLKSAAVKLEKKLAAGGEPKTDFPLAHTLARQFAEDPDGFAGINIYELRPEFGQAAFGLLESWHGLARKGSDEADERAAEIAALFEQGTRHITDAGLNPDSRDKDEQAEVSRFLFRFVAEASDFRKANGALPKAEDLSEIARQFMPLLPEASRKVEATSSVGEEEPSSPTAFDLPPDLRNTETWRRTFERLVDQHDGDELAAAEGLDQIFQAIRTKPLEELSPQEQDVVVGLRLEQLNFPDADTEYLSSIYRNWEPWKQRYRHFLDQNGGKHDEAAAMADLAVEEAIRINTEHADLAPADLSNAKRLFVQQIRFQMNGEDAAVFRNRAIQVRPVSEPERVLVPRPKDLTPAFRDRRPWINLHAQLLRYFDGNDTIATIVADALISEAEARKPEELTLGGMTPLERYLADQVRFNRFGGPDHSGDLGLELIERPFIWWALNLAADFLPIIGDIKAFYEAETPLDYILATVGLASGVGDVANVALKSLFKSPIADIAGDVNAPNNVHVGGDTFANSSTPGAGGPGGPDFGGGTGKKPNNAELDKSDALDSSSTTDASSDLVKDESAKANLKTTKPAGGAYRRVRGEKGMEAHHTPANSISPVSRGKGPAIKMEKHDHQDTASYGNLTDAKKYREKQKQLIDKGNVEEAIQMDIDDIRRRFRDKYNEGIDLMLEYLKSIRDLFPSSKDPE